MSAAPFVVILTLGAYDYIGVQDYPTKKDCERVAVLTTMNLQGQAKCIANTKKVKDKSTGADGDQPELRDPERGPEAR